MSAPKIVHAARIISLMSFGKSNGGRILSYKSAINIIILLLLFILENLTVFLTAGKKSLLMLSDKIAALVNKQTGKDSIDSRKKFA